MKHRFSHARLAAALFGAIGAISLSIPPVAHAESPQHVGPPSLYPDPTLTPGKAATLNVGALTAEYTRHCHHHKAECTYSQSHRHVPREEHTEVYDEYHVPPDQRHFHYGEVDHFYPLCAGGSNDIHNLWYEPAVDMWHGQNFGYHQKDKLEEWVCERIKAGQLDPKEAYDRITTDWVQFYLEVIHRHHKVRH